MLAALVLVTLLSHDGGVPRDQFKNPTDLDGYVAAQEAPDRAGWQKPDEILDALELRPGQTICDIGAGPGYFTLRAAKRVGEGGRVFAVDVEPRILDVLRTRVGKAGARNVTPVLALAGDPLLPPRTCDLVLIIDTYHHLPDRAKYLARLPGLLRPRGRIAIVDWHKHKTAVGPEMDHRVHRQDVLAEAAKAGLRVVGEQKFLPYQYFIIVAPR